MLRERKQKIALIHIAKKELGLNDENYRAILLNANINSASEIESEEQFKIIMRAFENLGFKRTLSNYEFKNKRSGGGANRLTSKQEYYIRGLWDLASRNRSERSLRAIVYRITGEYDISWLSKKDASKVILALRDICKKAGYNPDTKQS
ncbi:regulatory protein GemA [Treponema pedis]|uniref:Regulatory protein GemA n=2 Tax=Treponema phagedenis TaxID=162 RepID=A0A0B7GX92_TREPH|nr:regulatory protein GemA [Treponema phagedenis]NVP23796.1 regulatory protein GemA [Treponema phagedenis]NVP23831.1 regulatory protein GemA [Treponema phagedenis]NVP24911.1 regulatory protein GemA [Treponema phagedenis]NVP25443.1 regulatory protein GemA [Treponema phagedenis]